MVFLVSIATSEEEALVEVSSDLGLAIPFRHAYLFPLTTLNPVCSLNQMCDSQC